MKANIGDLIEYRSADGQYGAGVVKGRATAPDGSEFYVVAGVPDVVHECQVLIVVAAGSGH